MFKKGDKVIALVDIDGIISKGTIGICNKDQYDTVYVEVKWDNFDQGWGAGKAHWNVEDKHIKLYQESIKTLNKDTVKVGQKVKVIADDARGLGFEHTFNNERHSKDYIGIITSIDNVTIYHSDHKWVHLDGAPSAICTMLLELLEEPKDVMPEYVECIKGYHTDLSTNDFNVVGKIYEVESYNSKSKELKLKGFSGSIASIKFDGNSKHLSTDYKISTKEEFDLQNNSKEDLVGRYLKALVNNPVSIGMDIGEYLLVTRFNPDPANTTYDVTRVKDNRTGFGIEVSDLPKFEVMPVGFNPKAKESSEFKVGDWVVITTNTNASVNYVGDVGQITGQFNTVNFKVTVKDRPDFSNSTRVTDMRLATPEEIAEAQKLERDEYISQIAEELDKPFKRTSEYWNTGKYPAVPEECYTKLPIVTSVKRSNIVPLKLEKQKSLINLPTI